MLLIEVHLIPVGEDLPIDDAGHNDLFRVGGEQIETAVNAFLKQAGPVTSPATQHAVYSR